MNRTEKQSQIARNLMRQGLSRVEALQAAVEETRDWVDETTDTSAVARRCASDLRALIASDPVLARSEGVSVSALLHLLDIRGAVAIALLALCTACGGPVEPPPEPIDVIEQPATAEATEFDRVLVRSALSDAALLALVESATGQEIDVLTANALLPEWRLVRFVPLVVARTNDDRDALLVTLRATEGVIDVAIDVVRTPRITR
jgi:hypothetical protein